MQQHRRLRKRWEFQKVQHYGLYRAHPLLVLRAAPNGLGVTRFGFTVGRGVASAAVARNRTRRRIREAVRSLPVKPGWDVVVVARREAAGVDYARIQEAVRELLRRAGILEQSDLSGEEQR